MKTERVWQIVRRRRGRGSYARTIGNKNLVGLLRGCPPEGTILLILKTSIMAGKKKKARRRNVGMRRTRRRFEGRESKGRGAQGNFG